MERNSAIPSSHHQHRDVMPAVMISAGIVFNVILHCPTGQVEGIDSAVNFLIREQYTYNSTDINKIIGEKFVVVDLQKAFHQAFHNGGGVTILYLTCKTCTRFTSCDNGFQKVNFIVKFH